LAFKTHIWCISGFVLKIGYYKYGHDAHHYFNFYAFLARFGVLTTHITRKLQVRKEIMRYSK
jgi:hypothetical protein